MADRLSDLNFGLSRRRIYQSAGGSQGLRSGFISLGGEEGRNFNSQVFITGTGLGKEGGALCGGTLQRSKVGLLNLFGALKLHLTGGGVGDHHFINCEIVCTAAGSSGNITGVSLTRLLRSPTRCTSTLTGQPQAL